MSIILITGDHPRHRFFVKNLIETGLVSGWIREKREDFIQRSPKCLSRDLKNLYKYHFSSRAEVEEDFFGFSKIENVSIHKTDKNNLNSKETFKFIIEKNPKLIISYGCHKLSDKFLEFKNSIFWNAHGGLSPNYRGVITHFWPSYFLEPQMTGVTLHETSSRIDGGNIIFQSASSMVKGDTLHMLSARNIKIFTMILKEKLKIINLNKLPKGIAQKNTGKIFKGSDWRPEHLNLIYNLYEDKIVDMVISGEIKGKEPNLINSI